MAIITAITTSAGRTGSPMIDITPGEICIGVLAVIVLIVMWRILTTDHPDDG